MFYLLVLTVYILFGTSVISITADELQCQHGWNKHNDRCFWFSDSNSTRNNATLECQSMEATLVTIDTMAINTFLAQNITGDTSYWIGLRVNNIATSAWRWNTGGRLVSRSTALYWCGNITDPTTACAAMYYDTEPCIQSLICSNSRPSICEMVLSEGMSSCPTNWNIYSDGTSRCFYIIHEDKMTRMEAARYCYNIGGRLVTVPSYLNKKYLTENRPKTDNVHWIGLSPYTWDDGIPYNWNNWDINGPNIGYKCSRLQPDATWKYGDCSTDMHHFICQKAASPFTTTIPTTELSTASSTATTQVVIEDTTSSASSSSAFSTIISSTTSISTRTVSTSSITRIARIPTTYTPETISSTQNVATMSTYTEPDITTIDDTENGPDITTIDDTKNGALGNSESTPIVHDENDVPIILYVLVVIYTAVGVTAIVFIGLLAKYISLRRRYEKLNDEIPNENEIDDIDFDDKNDHKLYENQEYIGVEQHESISSDKATVPQNVETDNVVYSDIDVDSRKPKDGNHIETKQTSGDTDTHQVNQVPFKQNSHDLSKGEHDVVKADDEHSEQGETSHLYYNDPDCMASVTNSEQVNIYDDPINVTISESDDMDI